MAHIVIVEDEPISRTLLAGYLERAGFRVSTAEDGRSMRRLLAASDVDLVLLDVQLPGESGFALGAALRASSNVGLIFVTRRGELADRVAGLELGADDYVTKPSEMRELEARVRAVLRRRAARQEPAPPPREPGGVERFGSWALDRDRRCLVSPAAEEIALSAGEIAILGEIVRAKGRVVARQTLVGALAGAPAESTSRSLDVLVHRLRRKLGEVGSAPTSILLTVHGVGYRLGVDVSQAGVPS